MFMLPIGMHDLGLWLAGWMRDKKGGPEVGGIDMVGVSFGLFRLAVNKLNSPPAIPKDLTLLYTVLEDGKNYTSRLLNGIYEEALPPPGGGPAIITKWGKPPTPSYFKFYVDNICKRVSIMISGMRIFQDAKILIVQDVA